MASRHNLVLDACDATTSPLACFMAYIAVILSWIFGHQQEILFVLMSLVFLCQLIGFGHRGWNWFKKNFLNEG